MSNIKVKNVPRLKLGDLLRRRKMTLKTFVDELGITTYEGLVIRCKRLGVQPPDESVFQTLNMPVVSSPTEGVVFLPATSTDDSDKISTPSEISDSLTFPSYQGDESNLVELEIEEGIAEKAPEKKQRKKKEGSS